MDDSPIVNEPATITEIEESGNDSAAASPGGASSKSQAGTSARKFKFRTRTPSQKNTIDRYMSKLPAKRGRDRDSSDEDKEDENKAPRLYNSPTKEEMEVYTELAKNFHKIGKLSKDKAEKYQELLNVANKEKVYYRDLRKTVLMGNALPKTPDYNLDVAMFEAQKRKIAGDLRSLGDLADVDTKAVDYTTSPDTSLDTSVDSSSVFTETD